MNAHMKMNRHVAHIHLCRDQQISVLFPPDLHIEIRHGLEPNADVEKRSAQRVKHLPVIADAMKRNLDDAINGPHLAQPASALQNPFLNGSGNRPFNFFFISQAGLLLTSLSLHFRLIFVYLLHFVRRIAASAESAILSFIICLFNE